MSDKKKHTFKFFKQKTARLFPSFRKVRKLTKITEEHSLDGSSAQSTVCPFQEETTSEPLLHSKREVTSNVQEYHKLKFADDTDGEYSEIGGDKCRHASSGELNSKSGGDEDNELPSPVTPVTRRYELGANKSGSIDSGIDCVLSPTLSNETTKASSSQETRDKRHTEILASATTLLDKHDLKVPKSQKCDKVGTCRPLSQEDSVQDHEVSVPNKQHCKVPKSFKHNHKVPLSGDPDSEIIGSKSSNRELNYHAASEFVSSCKAREMLESDETTNVHDNTYDEITMVDELIDNSSKSENSPSKTKLTYRPVKASILLHSPHLLVSPVPRLRKYRSTIDLESAKTSPAPWELKVNENSAFERTKPAYRSVRDTLKQVSEKLQHKEKDFKHSRTVQYEIKDRSHELSDRQNLSISKKCINSDCNKRMHNPSEITRLNDNIYCHGTNTVPNKKDNVNLKNTQTFNKPNYDVDVSSSSLDDSGSSLSSLENIVCEYSSEDSLHVGRVNEIENRQYCCGQEDRNRYMFEKQEDSSDDSSYSGSIQEFDEPFGLSRHQYMTSKSQKSVSKQKDKTGNLSLQSENVCRGKSLKKSHNVSNLQSESLKMSSSIATSATDMKKICKKSQCKSAHHIENCCSSKHAERTDTCYTLGKKETSADDVISRRNCHSSQKHSVPICHKQQTSVDDAFLEKDMKVDRWKRNSRLYSSLHSSFSYFKGRDHKKKVSDLHNVSSDERGHSKSTKAVQNHYESFPGEQNHYETFPGEQNNPCLDQFQSSTSIRANPMKGKTDLNQSDTSVHHYDELFHISSHSQSKHYQNRPAFWIEKRVGMEFSPAKRVLHKNKNMSEKDLCQQILDLYVMDDCPSDSVSDLSGQDPVSHPSALNHIYEELLPVVHSRSREKLENLDDSLLQYGTYVAPRVQQEGNIIDPNYEFYSAEAVKRCLQHGIKQGDTNPKPVSTPATIPAKPRPVSTPAGPVKDKISAKPRPLSTPGGLVEDMIIAKSRPMSTSAGSVDDIYSAKPRPLSTPAGSVEDIIQDMMNRQRFSSVPREKISTRGHDHLKLDGKENFFDEQFDKLTKFHTLRNGRRMVRYLTLEEAQSMITHFPPPKDPSRISWNEKLVEWDYHHHTPRQTPLKTKPILSQKNTSFPNSDDTPSPIVLTKLRRSKSLSRRYKNWPW